MGFENLKTKQYELLEYLQHHGYSSYTIKKISMIIRDIISNGEQNGWNTYNDVYHSYENAGYTKDYLREKRYCVRVIKHFDLEGKLPDHSTRSYRMESSEYENLPDEFKELISFYRQHETKRGKKESTIYHESLNAISFFCAMTDKNVRSLEEITENDVISFFRTEDGTQLRGCSYKKNIAAVFKAGLDWKEDPCRKILSFLPAFREYRKIIQYLTLEEVNLIKDTLHLVDNRLSLRDRAIGSLLLYTGLRSCDVAGLLQSSLDWENDIIHIIQKKTDVPLELPLTTTVGNAIFDYLCNERPPSEDEHVFLSEIIPYRPLTSGSIWNITKRIFKAADIRQNPSDRQGTHIFRHHAASHMLESGIARPVISRIFGHTSPDSLDSYLMADFKHLKECALSVEAFPIKKEVLAI